MAACWGNRSEFKASAELKAVFEFRSKKTIGKASIWKLWGKQQETLGSLLVGLTHQQKFNLNADH